jgi:hypothetical protein
MRQRSNHSTRYLLAPPQHKVINDVASGLRPDLRHSFLLRVSKVLQLSTQTGFVNDQLVSRAIERALAEVTAA